ncbi:unnamed protein product (macronuclear) [Paramecium tetraurelia]|uniref:Uncharacterized protein n=1 Tax=Paramecium tetraurelia TaxID=5888 RepID=A0EI54_PARTE|nr:uncharacterized protein GSPATT00027322001 [Paramecium tetraurelia]CAK94995.1 unnamed protein product [Paramecium tetraurelia]|eukprot:XP_001462368.1 hypothetical protein (macronuclear) [Paramecium tetraurelia strain d4-2]
MCIPFQSIAPPTQGTKKAVQMLQILGVSEFVVGLIKLFVLQQIAGFYDFFTIFIHIWHGHNQIIVIGQLLCFTSYKMY